MSTDRMDDKQAGTPITQSQDSSVYRWSTHDIPQTQRLDAYVGTLCETLMQVSLSGAKHDGFQASVTMASLGEVVACGIGGSKQRSSRTGVNIARSSDHAYNLILGIEGPWQWSNREETLCMQPGDLVLGDSREIHRGDFSDGYFALNVRLPIEWLHSWLPEPRRLVGKKISRSSKWGRILSEYVRQLSPGSVDRLPLSAQVMSDQVGALLALAAAEIFGSTSACRSPYQEKHDKIRGCVRQRCTEIALTAADVASSMRLSPRTLHRILAAHGETFGSLLINARLDVASRMLESRLFGRITSAEIGRRAGFIDPSHFIRAFRARFGRTPGDVRRDAN